MQTLPRPPTFSGRQASQIGFEIDSLVATLKAEGVKAYLEIGARHGDTFHMVMTSLPKGSRGIAVDLPGGSWGKSSSKQHLERVVIDLRHRGYDVRCLFGDSTDPAVIAKIKAQAPFDAALIDGDHRYEGVKADWLAYGPMARIVAFHDIAGEGQAWRDLQVQVPRLWNEIRAEHRHAEYVAEGSAMGIGVLWR